MGWVTSLKAAGALALSTTQLLARLLYVLSTPLRWCLRSVYASIIFLLSPVWAILSLGLGTASFAINLIPRLKYLYIYVSNLSKSNISIIGETRRTVYPLHNTNRCLTQKLACATIIGICAGCMLHGTSSFIFVLLGMDTSSERQKLRNQQHQRLLYTPRSSLEEEDKEYYEESSSSASWRRFGKRQHVAKVDPNELFEKRWKLLRTPEHPRRRRKGLLAQTIHEESSESDL
ncbi:hypothetical protein F4803DRAFT_475677 [Xylaria telfairii]|nr:hypothetical protein F4803DRAFT_475677 [Xylaria telfairii]